MLSERHALLSLAQVQYSLDLPIKDSLTVIASTSSASSHQITDQNQHINHNQRDHGQDHHRLWSNRKPGWIGHRPHLG